jgi:poly(A) polymerase Pap1
MSRIIKADDRLGVHGPGSDIDTICVCPRHIYKEHFFGEFQQMLREWPAVTEISVCVYYTIMRRS